MAKKFTVPEEHQKAFKALVQRANRRIKSSLRFIEKEQIATINAKRSLVFNYDKQENWASSKMPFSRSIKFNSQQDYEAYVRHLNRWGEEPAKGERFARHPERIKQDYKQAIIKTLIQTAIHYNIPLDNGKLPADMLNKIDKLSFDQLLNFYGSSDPNEDAMINEFETDGNVEVGDTESFYDLVDARIGELKKFIK